MNTSMINYFLVKDSHRKKAPSNKTPTLSKHTNIDIGWLIHQINPLYEVLKINKFFEKIK